MDNLKGSDMSKGTYLSLNLQNGDAEQVPQRYKDAVVKVTQLFHSKGIKEIIKRLGKQI